MTKIDMEQLKADRAEGTEGPLYALDDNASSGLALRGGKHHYPIAKMCSYWDGPGPRSDEAKANYRRFARVADLEAAFIEAVEVLESVLGHVDTPIARRKLGINSDQPDWLTDARAFLAKHTGASA